MTNERGFSITRYLVDKYVGHLPSEPSKVDPEVRTRCARLEAWTGILINAVLSVGKGLLGIMLNSISMMADAFHSASDVVTSVVVLVGFKIAESPPDEQHPFGHGRVEILCALIISVMLIVIAYGFLKSSYQRFQAPVPVKGSWVVAVLSVGGAAVKEWMTRFAIYLGKAVDAKILVADGWHHRTDAISSLLVAIALIASKYGYYRVDAILGIVVSVLIAYMGIDLALTSSSRLIGERASHETMQIIRSSVIRCKGVLGLHKVLVHDYGGRKSISLHISVKKELSLIESHDIAGKVEQALKAEFNGDIVVHVEPVEESTGGIQNSSEE